MKKIVLVLVVLSCISLSNTWAQRFKGGVLIGMNASQIDGDNWGGYYKTGLVLGAFVNTSFDEKWGGQLEIKYSSKGSANGFNHFEPQKIRLRYVDIPVLARYNATEKLKLEAGVGFNYLFSDSYYNGEWMDDANDDLHPIESALNLGINYTYFSRFDFNLRFSYSLFPVRGNSSTSSFGEGAFYNNVLTFGVYFHLGSDE